MKIVVGIVLSILAVAFMFCIWVFAKTSSIATNREEQMEIERKLKNRK